VFGFLAINGIVTYLLVHHMRDSQKLDVRKKNGKENYKLFVNIQDFYYKL